MLEQMQQDQKRLDEVTWRKAIAHHVGAEAGSYSRRLWSRQPTQGEVKAQYVVDDQARKRTWDLMETSAGGIQVRTAEEITSGTRVSLCIQFSDQSLHCGGITCHCTQTVGGYKVGIRLIFSE
jgi:PilZ domain